MSILITGAAGFIGFHLALRLLEKGYHIVGVDHINDYYDVQLKHDRLKILTSNPNFTFHRIDIANERDVFPLFEQYKFKYVIHLAAQAGVRYSIKNPRAYIHSNIVGFMNILEACRAMPVDHLIYASSSPVYGANTKTPFSTTDFVDHPVSLYAATKKSNELMAYTYSHLYQIPATGLRFFTVYGPFGRPDMAYYSFTKNIMEGNPIQVFNFGEMERDFTYIDDIVEGIRRLIEKPPLLTTAHSSNEALALPSMAPHKIYNIGNHQPVRLMKFITILEELIGKKAMIQYLPMQPGDVQKTFADIEDLKRDTGFYPATTIEDGLERFVKWYMDYYDNP